MRKGQCGQLICGIWLICGTVFSQSASSARERYAHGLEFVARGELDAAVVEFEAAYRIRPNYLVQYNLGQAYLELGNPVAALRAFEIYSRDGGREMPPERRQEVQALLSLCKKRVGYLSLLVDLAGVEVVVDGRSVGKSPVADALALSIGAHGVTATAPGRLPFIGRVEIESQKRVTLQIVLEAQPAPVPAIGQLVTHCTVPGVTWRLNGTVFAARDGQPMLAPLGVHKISWQRDGYVPSTQELEVKLGNVTHVSCRLRTDPQLPMSARGILTFLVNQPNAEILLDGQRTSPTATVPVGPHVVRVHHEGFEDWAATITARASFPANIQVRLRPTAAHALELERDARARRSWAYAIGGTGVALLGTSLALYVDANHRYVSWESDNAALIGDLRAGGNPEPRSQDVIAIRERAVSIQRQDDWAVAVGALGAGLLSYAVVSWLGARPQAH